MNILALIPARGGSKSIPRKNLQKIDGHPLIAFSIAAGLQARFVNRVVVSTDDEEIANIAKLYGAEVPFLRPKNIAGDNVLDLPVVLHALDWLKEKDGYDVDIVIQLRPTSPFRPVDCVDSAIRLLVDDPNADSVRGVVKSSQNPYKMWRIIDGYMQPLLQWDIEEPYNQPRQLLPQTYWQTGHIDAIRVTSIRKYNSLSGKVILPLMIDSTFAIDIDKPSDLEQAEWLYERIKNQIVRPFHTIHCYKLANVKLLVLDFDGVFTDNRVLINEKGEEAVFCSRSDGYGLDRVKAVGIIPVILSQETNQVVHARGKKLNIVVYSGIENKKEKLLEIAKKFNCDLSSIAYIGNDLNDIPCFEVVGVKVAVADAEPAIRKLADIVLENKGGMGAIREFCELLINIKKDINETEHYNRSA